SHDILEKALQILVNLEHRGACGCEKNTGDGAGVLLQIPHAFLARECARLGIDLPAPGGYGVGLVFLPTDPADRAFCERAFERIIREEGQAFLGWRDVPTDSSMIGQTAKSGEPVMRQVFVGRGELAATDALAFERKLYVIRKRAENAVRASDRQQRETFYVPRRSGRPLVDKGMLSAVQLPPYCPALADRSIETALALVHSRFSTNTFPTWARAHPYRYVAHNGEINTLRGNVNWMRTRESLFRSGLFGDDLE